MAKKLTPEECKKKLIEAVEDEVELKIDNYRETVCAPRIEVTNKLASEMAELREDVKGIHNTLNSIGPMNGGSSKGLEPAFREMYQELKLIREKLSDVLTIVGPDISRRNAWTAIINYVKVSSLAKIWANRLLRWAAIIFILLFVNSVLHALGIPLDFESIIKFISGIAHI